MSQASQPATKAEVYDLFISLVAIASMILIGILFAIDPKSEMAQLITYIDLGICVLFFADFLRNLIRAENRLKYMST